MNKKAEITILGGLALMLLLIASFFGFLYFASNNYDYECLKKYAIKYCKENEVNYESHSSSWLTNVAFSCKENREWKSKYFIFIEAEKENCKTKEDWSFRRLK